MSLVLHQNNTIKGSIVIGHPILVRLMQVEPHKTPSGMLSICVERHYLQAAFFCCLTSLNCGFEKMLVALRTLRRDDFHSSSCK